jgi:hypothetical protein
MKWLAGLMLGLEFRVYAASDRLKAELQTHGMIAFSQKVSAA